MFLDKKLIIFDLDGTLIDSLGVWSRVDQTLISRLTQGRIELTEDEAGARRQAAMRRYGEGSEAYLRYMADMKAEFDLPGTPEEIHHQRYEIAQEFLRNQVNYREGVSEVVKALSKAGLMLAVATTTRRRNIETYIKDNQLMRNQLPLEKYFRLIVTRDDVRRVKPDPEVFEKIMTFFKVQPAECLVVEDALPGLLAAQACGIERVVVSEPHNEMPRTVLDALSLRRFENYAQMRVVIEKEVVAKA